MPLPSVFFVKNPVPWTLTSDRVSCATAIMDSSATSPKIVAPARFFECFSSIHGLLFVLRRLLLAFVVLYECGLRRSCSH
jgi:hypothetical protein